jgi:hypothetical protein
MTPKDYRIAYKFLKIRATESSQKAFRVLDGLPKNQVDRIINFLSRVHNVKFI